MFVEYGLSDSGKSDGRIRLPRPVGLRCDPEAHLKVGRGLGSGAGTIRHTVRILLLSRIRNGHSQPGWSDHALSTFQSNDNAVRPSFKRLDLAKSTINDSKHIRHGPTSCGAVHTGAGRESGLRQGLRSAPGGPYLHPPNRPRLLCRGRCSPTCNFSPSQKRRCLMP